MKKRVLVFYTCLFLLLFLTGLRARDINLDAIYINQSSRLYERLLERKLEAYQAAGSRFIDRDVIFAGWGDGFTVLYVKELPRLNVVYSFNRTTGRIVELFRIQGTVTAFRNSTNGKYLFIKRLLAAGGGVPRGETLVLNVPARTIRVLPPSYPFIDFSLAPGGNSLFYETRDGIVEYNPDTDSTRVTVRRPVYVGIVTAGAPSIAYMSPNRTKTIIVSGSGGSYRSRMLAGGQSRDFPGITSASEIYWVDNTRLAYRTGDAGNYSVRLYDTAARRGSTLMNNSLNTNLQFSAFPKMISFLKDQVMFCHDLRGNESVNTGLEGEDASFSPDGNRFVSLYLKRLFLTNLVTVKKKNIEMTKIARQIVSLYRELLQSRGDLANEYSAEYVRKKISVYGRMAD